MDTESKETMADEASESPTMQKKEMAEGTEEHIIPEDFQRECMKYVAGLNKAQLDYLRDCCNRRSDELYKEQQGEMFSDEDMPS